MPFPSWVGKTGKHRFGTACKYRGRTDDCLWTGRPIFENKDRSKAKYETGICYSAEIACEGNIWQKDDTKCENIRCKAVPYQIAAGRWEKLQFHSYHSRSAATSLSDGGGWWYSGKESIRISACRSIGKWCSHKRGNLQRPDAEVSKVCAWRCGIL